ncbi:hypothetical protein BDZ97DRAFT_32376 [Flammula alnicola]|nr:hypothetical protein BDZ97DRAFT_32376 [Flammula alnicola]
METDSDYLPPPPAYSEQEFDRKISLAADISIRTRPPPVDEDGWERYDPSALEAVSTASTKPVPKDVVNYSTTSFNPTADSKAVALDGSPVTLPPVDNGGGVASGSSAWLVKGLLNSDEGYYYPYPSTHDPNGYYDKTTAIQEEEISPESRSSSPPLFINNLHLDSSRQMMNAIPQGRLAESPRDSHIDPYYFQPHKPLNTTAQSYGAGDYQNPLPDPGSYYTAQPRTPRRPLPSQPRHPSQSFAEERPVSGYQSPQIPRMNFNPSIAYSKTPASPTYHHPIPKDNVQYDPHSFYNSAVSAQLTPLRSVQGGPPSPSYNERQYQGQVLQPNIQPRPGHQPQYLNSQFPARSVPLIATDNPRQSMWQASSSSRMSAANVNRFSQYPDNSGVYGNQMVPENGWCSTR